MEEQHTSNVYWTSFIDGAWNNFDLKGSIRSRLPLFADSGRESPGICYLAKSRASKLQELTTHPDSCLWSSEPWKDDMYVICAVFFIR